MNQLQVLLPPIDFLLAQFDVGCKQNNTVFPEFCCLDFKNNTDTLRTSRRQAEIIRQLQDAVKVVGLPDVPGDWFGWLKKWGLSIVGGLCVLAVICMIIPCALVLLKNMLDRIVKQTMQAYVLYSPVANEV